MQDSLLKIERSQRSIEENTVELGIRHPNVLQRGLWRLIVYQITRFPQHTGTSRPAVTDLSGLVPLKSLAVPTDDGFRSDDDQGRAPTRPQARKPNPKTSISSAEDETVCLLSSLQHDQLMTERDDLGPHHRLTMNAG